MSKLLLLLLVFTAAAFCYSEARVICYFASWTIYRNHEGNFSAGNVDPNLCTHIMYAFVGVNTNGTVLMLDDWEFNGLGEVASLMSLRSVNPNLKVILSMGGWGEGSIKYSNVAQDPALRQNLVNSVIEWLDQYGFDGFDLDWEYPNQLGGVAVDVQNYVSLLRELKAALAPRGKSLSAAVAGAGNSIDLSYDVAAVSEQLDFINIMAYDFHGDFETFVGHHSPLYGSHLDPPEFVNINVAAGVQHWLDRGADPSKLNLGIGTYGRGFTLADPDNNQLYDTAYSGSQIGPWTQSTGILGYHELCALHSDWQYIWDDEQQVPHRLSGNQWVGYDDERSLQIKVQFAKSKGLGGMMVWSLDTDDFLNLCGGGAYPLLRTLNDAWNS